MKPDAARLRHLDRVATDDQLARMCALGFDRRELTRPPAFKWWVRPMLLGITVIGRLRRTWSRIRR